MRRAKPYIQQARASACHRRQQEAYQHELEQFAVRRAKSWSQQAHASAWRRRRQEAYQRELEKFAVRRAISWSQQAHASAWRRRRQEAYQRELEKFAVRRAPLGADRAHRRYWWGLAGRRGVVLTEDAAGCVGFLTAAAQLDGIAAVLDARGCREAGLQAALEKVGGCQVSAQG